MVVDSRVGQGRAGASGPPPFPNHDGCRSDVIAAENAFSFGIGDREWETAAPLDDVDGRGPAMTVCAGDGRSSGLEKARCGDPDGNEYRAGLIQNSNAAFWGRDLFREFGDLAPYGAQAAEFDRAQRRNRLVVLYHLEIIALQDRLARRPICRRRRVEPLRALPDGPKDGNLPGDYARQLVWNRAQPEPAVYRKLNINGRQI